MHQVLRYGLAMTVQLLLWPMNFMQLEIFSAKYEKFTLKAYSLAMDRSRNQLVMKIKIIPHQGSMKYTQSHNYVIECMHAIKPNVVNCTFGTKL